MKQPGWSTVCHARGRFSVPGCSHGSQEGGLRCSALGRRGFCPWLLCKAARKGFLFLSLPPSFLLFIYTYYLLRLPGCYAKQPGESTVGCTQQVQFSVPGCSHGSQGSSLRCAAIGGCGFRSLAALRSSQKRFAVPFPSPLFFLFTDANYILRVPGCYTKQPGWSTVFSPWLLMRQPGGRSAVFCTWQGWFLVPVLFPSPWSTVCRAQARFSVPGCSRSSQEGSLRCSLLGWRGFWSLAALHSS